jgi:2-methylisocitrate lyase-like PEP mutase family enzyme
MVAKTLKALLNAGEFIAAPGVFDLLSAKIADRTDAKALYMTGFGTAVSYLGYRDARLASDTDMLNRASIIAQAVKKPLIADGDSGCGSLLTIHHTVRGYERAGVAMIQLEDQQTPKKYEHTPARHIVSIKEMVSKIRVASDSRSSRDFLIMARTDARTSDGFDEALRRAELYAQAGADAIFIEGMESIEEMTKIGSALDVPLVANQTHGGHTPILPQARLMEIGFSVAIYPTAGLFAAAKALAEVYVAHVSDSAVEAPISGIGDFADMMGFHDHWNFERKYTDLLEIETGGRA